MAPPPKDYQHTISHAEAMKSQRENRELRERLERAEAVAIAAENHIRAVLDPPPTASAYYHAPIGDLERAVKEWRVGGVPA